jgi:hypothetical protein
MSRVFPIIPPSSPATFWVFTGSVIFFLLLAVFFGFLGYSARNTKFELTSEGLQIKGGVYRRFIPKSSLIREEAKILDLNAIEEFQTARRINGTSLPGYNEGWFKLKNGEKALLFVTDRSGVVYIPTKENYSVLLSTSRPEEFLTLMKEL